MNAKTAERLLPCHHAGHEVGKRGERIHKATRLAEQDEHLKPRLEAQEAFDRDIEEKIAAIEMPGHLEEKLAVIGAEAEKRRDAWRAPLKNPAVLAAVLSLAVVAVVVIRGAMERAENFTGREIAQGMVEDAQHFSGVEFEPIKPTELEKLADWFAMNGVDRFETPPEFAKLTVVGCRVYKQSGFPVAQALVEKNNMIVYVFRGRDLGIKVEPSAGWYVFEQDDWAGAARGMDDLCFMIAFRGTKADMKQFLASGLK